MTFIEFVYMFTATVIVIGQWHNIKHSRTLFLLQLEKQRVSTELMLAHIKIQDKAIAVLVRQIRDIRLNLQ